MYIYIYSKICNILNRLDLVIGAGSNGKGNLRAYEFLHSMKNTCQTRRPGVSCVLVFNFDLSTYNVGRVHRLERGQLCLCFLIYF